MFVTWNERDTVMLHSYTASYAGCLHSFTIVGIPEGKSSDKLLLSFTSILKNIMRRGKKVRPSNYLVSQIGKLQDNQQELSLVSIDAPLPHWENTIKGADGGYNPARDFYYADSLWQKQLSGYEWVRQLIIPEADLQTILEDQSSKWQEQSVDFYIAAAKLVIEIDGIQHTNNASQQSLDQERDQALAAKGITVVRIPVAAVRGSDYQFAPYASRIRDCLDGSAIIQEILKQAPTVLKNPWLNYEAAIRYQFVLLELIEAGALTLRQKKWKFDIVESLRDLFTASVNDLLLWYENLYKLAGKSIRKPEIEFGRGKAYLPITIRLFTRPDERQCSGIAALTDLWDGTDYYRVSCADVISYGIPWPLPNESPQYEALVFFLNNVFGYDEYKEGQLQIITSILNRNRTIGILPTGGGKSLCYQLPVLLQPAISFVVCPIVSLQIDQKSNLDQLGFTRTAYLESGQNREKKADILEQFRSAKLQLIWISPERFQSRDFRNTLKGISNSHGICYAIIDEVHCLSEWGHDFRTSYLTLLSTIQDCTKATVIGLTATASQAVLNDLKAEFGTGTDVRALPSLERKNLEFKVITTDNPEFSLKQILREQDYGKRETEPHNGIVFSLVRDKSDDETDGRGLHLAMELRQSFPENAAQIGVFHGQLAAKRSNQEDFINGKLHLLSATKAFGMGINKPDVHFTVHYQLPWSVEAFYQEAGRAGRDESIDAKCYVLFTPDGFGTKANIAKAFDRNSTPEQIKKCKLGGDLGTIFFLWGRNNVGVESDVGMIRRLREKLASVNKSYDSESRPYYTISPDLETNQEGNTLSLTRDRLELALYRLKQLGVVLDWLIDWRGNTSFDIYLNHDTNEESVADCFFRYIRKYNPSFGKPWREEDIRYRTIIENTRIHYVYRYAWALIAWTYDHIIYARRQATKNMMDFCAEYTDPEQFRTRIDNFLRVSDQTVIMDGIVEDPQQWHLWFGILSDSKINEEGVRSDGRLELSRITAIHDACARYLESYRDVVGLNLVYVLSGIICGYYDDRSDGSLLDSCLKGIGVEFSRAQEAAIIESMLATIRNYRDIMSNEDVNALSRHILKGFPERSKQIYDSLGDDYSLAFILQQLTNTINQAMEGLK